VDLDSVAAQQLGVRLIRIGKPKDLRKSIAPRKMALVQQQQL